MQAERSARASGSHVLVREVNERIRLLQGSGSYAELDFVCECGDPHCFAVMTMTIADYERVRALRGAHVVLPGHSVEGHRVAAATERFAVVEPATSWE